MFTLRSSFKFMLIFFHRFVDRDMIMRFRGGGVGHTSTRAATNIFKADRDVLDMKSGQNKGPPTVTEPYNVEDQDDEDMGEVFLEDSDVEIDDEGELSESEVVDYRYELEEEEGEEEGPGDEDNDGEGGEEDDTAIDELDLLGYAADY